MAGARRRRRQLSQSASSCASGSYGSGPTALRYISRTNSRATEFAGNESLGPDATMAL